ncbi:MAG: hypothetical protein WC748_03300 [Legionellales bacterium]|jgi:hypothetical protein
MLYQIYNDCLQLIQASGRFDESIQPQQLPETTSPSAVIQAMQALTNIIKKHPSLQSNKKEEWEGFSDCLEIAESMDLISQTNMFEEIQKAMQQEFLAPAPAPAPQPAPPPINKQNIFKSQQISEFEFDTIEEEQKVDNFEISSGLKELYRLYKQIEEKYNGLNSSSSSSSSSSASSDQKNLENDEQMKKYMMRIALRISSETLTPFFEESTLIKFNDIRKNLQKEDIKNKLPLLNELGIILADLFELRSSASIAPVLVMDFSYNNDPLAFYKSIYKEYIENSERLSIIPAANDLHPGPLVKKEFNSAEAILLDLLNYVKKLNLSFLEGFSEDKLYKKLCLELDKVKNLDETASREQLFLAVSGFNTQFTLSLKNIGFEINYTMN